MLPNNMENNELTFRIEKLERDMLEHNHTGHMTQRIDIEDLFGKFEVVSVAPLGKPSTFSQQVKIYTNGATYRLYWYDTTAGVWHYVTATA